MILLKLNFSQCIGTDGATVNGMGRTQNTSDGRKNTKLTTTHQNM